MGCLCNFNRFDSSRSRSFADLILVIAEMKSTLSSNVHVLVN